MKISYTFFWLLCSTILLGQPLSSSWLRTLPGNQFEENNSLAQAPCGDLYTAGFFQDRLGGLSTYGTDNEDGFVTKYNEQGQLLWVLQLRGSNTDRVNGIHVTTDNEVYIVGEFRDTLYCGNDTLLSNGRLDLFVAKLDSSGVFQWALSAGDNEDDSAYDIDVLSDGNLVLTGYHEQWLHWGSNSSRGLAGRDVFVATISPQGNPGWVKTLVGPAADQANAVATDDYGHLYITGNFRDFLFVNGNQLQAIGGLDVFVAQYDLQGTLNWAKVMGSPGGDHGSAIAVDGAQNIVAAGWVSGSLEVFQGPAFGGSQEEDAFALKLDSNGTVLWGEVIAYTFDERLYGVDFDQNNNVYLMGTLDSVSVLYGDTLRNRHLNRPTDIFVAKYSADKTYRWSQSLGDYYNDFCYDLLVPNSRTLYIVGSFQDSTVYVTDSLVSDFGYDIFLGKFLMDTTISVRQTVDSPSLLPAQLVPNPSTHQMLLSYQLSTAQPVRLSLYTSTSQRVWRQSLGNQPAGNHQLPLKRKQLPAGLYYLYVEAGNTHRVLPLIWR